MTKTGSILAFFAFALFCNAQEPIFVNAGEIGNGIGFERFGESFILTPAHVVDTSVGSILLSDSRKANSEATLLETYANDIAILRVEEPKSVYLPLVLSETYNDAISNASSGFVSYLDDVGIVNYIHVNITSKDQSSFTVTPQSPKHTFKKGMSGSPFYVMHNGVKTLSGMLMSIEEGAIDGFIFQLDDIITTVDSFIKNTQKKDVVKLGVLIHVESAELLPIINRINSEIKDIDGYTMVSRLPERKFIDKNFDKILSSAFTQTIPNKLKNTIHQFLLGKIALEYDTNEKGMNLVYISFEGGLYASEDASLIKSINIQTKGLGYKKNAAKEQAIKSILTKIKNRLNEN